MNNAMKEQYMQDYMTYEGYELPMALNDSKFISRDDYVSRITAKPTEKLREWILSKVEEYEKQNGKLKIIRI